MNSHDRNKGAEPGFVVRCRTGGEGPVRQGEYGGGEKGERRQDFSCIPPSCDVLHRSEPAREVSTLFDLRGATNERQGTGTAEREPPAFLSGLLRCCVVW